MKKLSLSLMLVAALGLGVAQADAAYVGSVPGGTGINDVLIAPAGPFAALEGWYGANLYLIAGADTAITVEYMGFEAGFTNYFYINGVEIINNQTTPIGSLGDVVMSPGLMTFAFQSPLGWVTNGTNVVAPNIPNFFLTLFNGAWDTTVNGVTNNFGTSVILALDDGGAGIDDNHDDLVVKLTISNGTFERVPDGGMTLALLGGALLGLGAIRRRIGR
jgi:hypothetical protein